MVAQGGRILGGERRTKSVPEILAGQGRCSFWIVHVHRSSPLPIAPFAVIAALAVDARCGLLCRLDGDDGLFLLGGVRRLGERQPF